MYDKEKGVYPQGQYLTGRDLPLGGYLEERERASSKGGTKKFKALTPKGLEYGANLINEKNQREVQPYYYADTFMELFGNVCN